MPGRPLAKGERKPFGIPLHCPKCPPSRYFGMLKIPSTKVVPCPNCGSKLVRSDG